MCMDIYPLRSRRGDVLGGGSMNPSHSEHNVTIVTKQLSSCFGGFRSKFV